MIKPTLKEEINRMHTLIGLLCENAASKRQHKARNVIRAAMPNASEENITKIYDAIRNDIPNVRGIKETYPYFPAVARLYVTRQLTDGNDILTINNLLPLIETNHGNEYNDDLNGEDLFTIVSKLQTEYAEYVQQKKDALSNEDFTPNNNYKIVKIDSQEQASQYNKFTDWCITYREDMWESYTNNGINQFYFCLKDGFENVPREKGENCPLDEYGLSMIAVSVCLDGSPNTITCRWNHANGGNDNVMSDKELSQVIGANFYSVFKPNEEALKKIERALEAARRGDYSLCDYHKKLENDYFIVDINDKWYILKPNGELLVNKGFDRAYLENGYFIVEDNDKCYILKPNGELLVNKGFDSIHTLSNGYFKIKDNDKRYILKPNGELLINKGFDRIYLENGYFIVEDNDKCYILKPNGELLINKGFDNTYVSENGYFMVEDNDKWYILKPNGELLVNKSFDAVYDLGNEYFIIKYNHKWYFLKPNGEFLVNKCFDDVYRFSNGFFEALYGYKCYILKPNGEFLINKSFKSVSQCSNGYFTVLDDNYKWYILKPNGEFLINKGFDDVYLKNGYFIVEDNGKWYALNQDGKLLEY